MRFGLTFITVCIFAVSAQVMNMAEAVRYCFKDGSTHCPSLGHGKAMRDYHNEHYKQLSPNCQNIVLRLNRGETLSMF